VWSELEYWTVVRNFLLPRKPSNPALNKAADFAALYEQFLIR
jgi:hypothetical protein